jgi:hypothetical protein
MRIEKREVARLEGRLAPILDHSRTSDELQTKYEYVVLIIPDVSRIDRSMAQAEAVDFDDAEFSERRCVDRRIKRGELLHAAFVFDEDFVGNVMPIRETIAGVQLRHRQDLVHASRPCVPSSAVKRSNILSEPLVRP